MAARTAEATPRNVAQRDNWWGRGACGDGEGDEVNSKQNVTKEIKTKWAIVTQDNITDRRHSSRLLGFLYSLRDR